MKKILAILFLITTFACKTQTPIIPLDGDIYPRTENAYYKDTEGILQELVGTWLYTDGYEFFKVIIKLNTQEYTESFENYYEDILFGEYRYVDENGTELVNSLSDIDNQNMESIDHLIWGNDIQPSCDNCPDEGTRVELNFEDPQRSYLPMEITVRVLPDPFDQYPEERMEMVVEWTAHLTFVDPGQPTDYRIPEGNYILIKQ